jgi:hypothetical protein
MEESLKIAIFFKEDMINYLIEKGVIRKSYLDNTGYCLTSEFFRCNISTLGLAKELKEAFEKANFVKPENIRFTIDEKMHFDDIWKRRYLRLRMFNIEHDKLIDYTNFTLILDKLNGWRLC